MGPDALLLTPHVIDECVRREFPDATVQIDGEHEVLNIVLPQTLGLPDGAHVTISTAVVKQILIDVINEIAEYRLTPQGASQDVVTGTPLSGWDEAISMQGERVRRRQFESQRGSCTDAIVAYLNNPSDQGRLSALREIGLAPGQVHPHDEEDLRHFRVIKECKLSKAITEFFATKYGDVYGVLKEMCVQQEIAKLREEEVKSPSSIAGSTIKKLHSRVVGQKIAVEAMASVLLRKQGTRNKTFLFVGPTGVGKTELAEAVGALKGNRHFVKFDMTQYKLDYQVSAFSGSATGLLGSDDLPEFSKKIESAEIVKKFLASNGEEYVLVRDIVILFDEIGKAHTTIRSALLTLFDKGTHATHYTFRRETFGKGENRAVNYTFENCIFIGTSNLFQELIVDASKRRMKTENIVDLFTKASAQAVSAGYPSDSGETPFAPEVLGRMNIIPFEPIPKGPHGYQAIVDMKLKPWIVELDKSFQESFSEKCGRILIEEANRHPLLALIEAGLYGVGTNVRKIVTFLDGIQRKLDTEKRLKMTAKVELSIYANGNSVYAQRYIVDDFYSAREKYGDPLKLHSFEIGEGTPS